MAKRKTDTKQTKRGTKAVEAKAAPRNPVPKIKRISSDVTYAALKQLERTQERVVGRPKTLKRGQILCAPKAFQWRLVGEDMQGSEDHVRALAGALKAGKPLEPVLVTAVGQSFYLLDGHHRMDAYHTMNWDKPIPVEVFAGSLSRARDEAFARNRNDKLPMSTEAKSEAAWKRFLDSELTWSELLERFGVSRDTLRRMNDAKKAIEAEGKHSPSDLSWREARRGSGGGSVGEFDYSQHARKAALEMSKKLRSVSNFSKDANITAEAILLADRTLPRLLVEGWDRLRRKRLSGLGDDLSDVLEIDLESALPVVLSALNNAGRVELAESISAFQREVFEDESLNLDDLTL